MEIININEDNLQEDDINRKTRKVRAILRSKNKILVADYGGVIILPGGKIDKDESEIQALIRELKEETGKVYTSSELIKIMQQNYYQTNYPTRDGSVINRLITTEFYFASFKGVDLENTERTEKEKDSKFTLKLMDYNELVEKLNEKSDNPRREFFNTEMKEVLKVLSKVIRNNKTLELDDEER